MVRRTIIAFLVLYTIYFLVKWNSLLAYNILAWVEFLQNGTPYSMSINLWAEYFAGMIMPVIYGVIFGNILKPFFRKKESQS
uniref:Uncharacterized protein n=1 Tax=uncultured bacterium A1Q1_fos_2004 TaxID=1256557 RepID=L7VXJ2_9BACT|nr:hypothetical protein [uncultured bacterium A1Q1_fos_2004]